MLGLMQAHPLSISSIIDHAALNHPRGQVISIGPGGAVDRRTYPDIRRRAIRLAQAVAQQGIRPGERVGTIAANGYRHLELYYGLSGSGVILHTINPHLSTDQLAHVINHAVDRLLFVDPRYLSLLAPLRDRLPQLDKIIVLGPPEPWPIVGGWPQIDYASFLAQAAADPAWSWPRFDENTASTLCYTSGTTGLPKGVLYSHRSTVLMSMALCSNDGYGLAPGDTILPAVPMFHANAWGLPYGGPMTGANLVLPGHHLDGDSLVRLLIAHEVTFAAGVPTIWQRVLDSLDRQGLRLNHLRRTVIGGTACSEKLIRRLEQEHGIEVLHSWGMTETSPLGTVAHVPADRAEDFEARLGVKLRQGRPVFGLQIRITDESGHPLPPGAEQAGQLEIRGPWITRAYFRQDQPNTRAGEWFPTGDIATIDADNTMQITDRAKDLIKSGGEWISSVHLEHQMLQHTAVRDAAVIGVPHPTWQERPLMLVVLEEDASLSLAQMHAHLGSSLPRWWLPNGLVIVSELPRGATGKVLKHELRRTYRDHLVDLSTSPGV